MSTYPHADAVVKGSSQPATNMGELDDASREVMQTLARLIASFANNGLLVLPVTHETKVVYVTDPTRLMASGRMVASKTNRIAMAIGAVLGLIAGIVLVNYLDPGVFRVDNAAASYQAVLSTIVNETWFEITALVLCTGLGWAIGSLFGPRATLRLQVWATSPDGKLHTVKTVRSEDIAELQA